MKIRKLVSALSVAFLLGAATPARAQEPEQKPDLKNQQQNRTVVGVVKEYEPGKMLTVATRDDDVATFKLDDVKMNLKLGSSISVGQTVKVVESTDAKGQRSLRIDPLKSSESQK